jgi:hypothetical protein
VKRNNQMKKKKLHSSSTIVKYDGLTEQIGQLLTRIPRVGEQIAKFYLWKYMLFNYMMVGASGVFLNWFVYEILIRPFVFRFWGGTFLGVTLTAIIVFYWNYTWNKRWSLKTDAQVMAMNKIQLMDLQEKITVLLKQKTDAKGKRISQ